MGMKHKPIKQRNKGQKRRRALDSEEKIAVQEKKAVKKHKKLEFAMQIQEARKRKEALKEAGTIHVDEVLRALSSTHKSGRHDASIIDGANVSSLLATIGIRNRSEDFAWSTESSGTSESEEFDDFSESAESDGSSFDEPDNAGSDIEENEIEDGDFTESDAEDESEEKQLHRKISFPESTEFSEESQDLLASLTTGKDMVYCREDFHDQITARSCYSVLSAYALSHMLHKVGKVERNNKRLSKNPDVEDVRDQGPNRPRLLWLAPFRSNAFEVTRNWLTYLNSDESVGNTASFLEEYKDQDVRNEHAKNWEDWRRELFKGHYDDSNYDDFVIGVSFHHGRIRLQFPKTSQALCAVDAIVASPLALSRIAAADTKSLRVREKFASDDSLQTPSEDLPPVMDFLSGIELVVVDRIDAMSMQNWENCRDVIQSVNLQAVATISADINRIEEKFLSPETARASRQTILISGSTILDEYASLSSGNTDMVYSSGIALKRALRQRIKQQLFVRVPNEEASHLDYFKNSFWKEVGNDVRQLVIVVSTATELGPLLEFLDDEGIQSSCCLAEETLSDIGGKRRKQIKSTLRAFREGENRILIITERLLWYQRIRITGARHVVFYGCPRTDSVYADILADVVDPLRSTCTCIYTTNEARAVERVVGTDEVGKLLESTNGDRKITVFTP